MLAVTLWRSGKRVDRQTVAGITTVFGLVGKNTATKTAFVAIRGTQTQTEWLQNLDVDTTGYRPVPDFGDVHMGWMGLYETMRANLAANLPAACAGCDQLIVTGHSLGAALAVLAAPDIAKNISVVPEPKLTTFGGPRPGLHDFVVPFNLLIDSCFRVVNLFDIVPHLPLALPGLPYEHVGVQVAVIRVVPSTRPTATAWTLPSWSDQSHQHPTCLGRLTIARECRPQDSVFTLTSAGAIRSSSRIPAAVRRTRTPGGQPIVISPRIRARQGGGTPNGVGHSQRCALGGIERRPGSLSKQPWISRRPTARQRRCHRVVTSKCEFGELAGDGLRRFLLVRLTRESLRDSEIRTLSDWGSSGRRFKSCQPDAKCALTCGFWLSRTSTNVRLRPVGDQIVPGLRERSANDKISAGPGRLKPTGWAESDGDHHRHGGHTEAPTSVLTRSRRRGNPTDTSAGSSPHHPCLQFLGRRPSLRVSRTLSLSMSRVPAHGGTC